MHLWEAKHAYYCNESNYFCSRSESVSEFGSWSEFMAEFGNADMDYNMVFRWDWLEEDADGKSTYKGDDYYRNGKLHLYFMKQRKGIFMTAIVDVCRADEGEVSDYLEQRWDYLMALWRPVHRLPGDRYPDAMSVVNG